MAKSLDSCTHMRNLEAALGSYFRMAQPHLLMPLGNEPGDERSLQLSFSLELPFKEVVEENS